MPRAEIPAGVARWRFRLRYGLAPGAGSLDRDSNGELIAVSDLPAIKAHWLEQLKEELLSDEVIDALAEQNAIQELYGHWGDFPATEAHQRRRYAQLAKKPGVQESWKAGARADVERFLAAFSSIPIEGETGS